MNQKFGFAPIPEKPNLRFIIERWIRLGIISPEFSLDALNLVNDYIKNQGLNLYHGYSGLALNGSFSFIIALCTLSIFKFQTNDEFNSCLSDLLKSNTDENYIIGVSEKLGIDEGLKVQSFNRFDLGCLINPNTGKRERFMPPPMYKAHYENMIPVDGSILFRHEEGSSPNIETVSAIVYSNTSMVNKFTFVDLLESIEFDHENSLERIWTISRMEKIPVRSIYALKEEYINFEKSSGIFNHGEDDEWTEPKLEKKVQSLFINPPKRQNDFYLAMEQVFHFFLVENERLPERAEAWTYFKEHLPKHLRLNQKQNAVVFDDKEVDKQAFLKRFDRYTK